MLTLAAWHAGDGCEFVAREGADITPDYYLEAHFNVTSQAACYSFCDQLPTKCQSAVYVIGDCYLKDKYPDATNVVTTPRIEVVLLWRPRPPC